MNITVTGRQFEITPSIREYVEKHIETLLEDKALNVTSVNVVMDREKNRFKSSIVVNCKYHVVPAEVEDFDLYKSFDAAPARQVDALLDLSDGDAALLKIDSQLTTLRAKIRDHQAQPMREAEPKAE